MCRIAAHCIAPARDASFKAQPGAGAKLPISHSPASRGVKPLRARACRGAAPVQCGSGERGCAGGVCDGLCRPELPRGCLAVHGVLQQCSKDAFNCSRAAAA